MTTRDDLVQRILVWLGAGAIDRMNVEDRRALQGILREAQADEREPEVEIRVIDWEYHVEPENPNFGEIKAYKVQINGAEEPTRVWVEGGNLVFRKEDGGASTFHNALRSPSRQAGGREITLADNQTRLVMNALRHRVNELYAARHEKGGDAYEKVREGLESGRLILARNDDESLDLYNKMRKDAHDRDELIRGLVGALSPFVAPCRCPEHICTVHLTDGWKALERARAMGYCGESVN